MSTLKDESEQPVAETGLEKETEAGGDRENLEAVAATGKQHELEAAAGEGMLDSMHKKVEWILISAQVELHRAQMLR